MVFKKLQDKFIRMEIRMAAAWRGEVYINGKKNEGNFQAAVNVLYLDLGSGHRDEYICKKPTKIYTYKLYFLICVSCTPTKKFKK